MKSSEPTPEMKLQQQNAARLSLRERLEEDSKITKMNQLKVTNQWRKIMRLAKTEALKADIEILSQNHERNLDRKDAILHMLVGDMYDAESQFQVATRSHLKNVDKLIEINDSGLKELEKMYLKHTKLLQKSFDEDMKILQEQFDEEKRLLIGSVESIDDNETNKRNDAKQAFEQQREEIRNHNVEDINMLRITLDSQIEDLEQQFETAHLNYMQQTGQRTHEYKDLAQNDKTLTEDIEKKKKKIDALQMLLLQWRGKTRQLVEDSDERRRMLINEKRNMQLHYQQLKNRIKTYRDLQNQRLLHLSNCAGACEQQLKNKLEVARSILSIAELAKMDKERMVNTLPFSDTLSSSNAVAAADVQNVTDEIRKELEKTKTHTNYANTTTVSDNGNSFAKTLLADKDKLHGFYKMYNAALLEVVEIERERDRLQLENQQLHTLISQYDKAKSIDADSLSKANTLLIVNGRTDINEELAIMRSHSSLGQQLAQRTVVSGGSSLSSSVKLQHSDKGSASNKNMSLAY